MEIAELLRRGAKEPLIHFLVAGAAVFTLFAWRGNDVDPASRTIIIDSAQARKLSAVFVQSRQREPSLQEVDALIREHIKEEVYYREALRIGLDVDDPLIRRRLRSKMEFLASAQIEGARPDNAVLQKMLERNPAKYSSDPVYGFDQIYLGKGALLDTTVESKAKSVLSQLAATDGSGADWQQLGEALSVPRSMNGATPNAIAGNFGDEFALALPRIYGGGAGTWAGPIQSGFGSHLVRVREVKYPKPPTLDTVRRTIENDWKAATLARREEAAYQALLDGYTIRIIKP
jgi:peptidyl-prolyl cis-trans isomerase C